MNQQSASKARAKLRLAFATTILVNLVPLGVVFWLMRPQNVRPVDLEPIAIIVASLFLFYQMSPYVFSVIAAKLFANSRAHAACILTSSILGALWMVYMTAQGFDNDRCMYFVFMPFMQWTLLLIGCTACGVISLVDVALKNTTRLLSKKKSCIDSLL